MRFRLIGKKTKWPCLPIRAGNKVNKHKLILQGLNGVSLHGLFPRNASKPAVARFCISLNTNTVASCGGSHVLEVLKTVPGKYVMINYSICMAPVFTGLFLGTCRSTDGKFEKSLLSVCGIIETYLIWSCFAWTLLYHTQEIGGIEKQLNHWGENELGKFNFQNFTFPKSVFTFLDIKNTERILL